LEEFLETQPSPRQIPSWRTLTRWSLTLFSIWLVCWLLWTTGAQLIPFILGLVGAYLLLPLVNKLARYIPRWAAIVVIYVIGFGLFIGAIIFVVPPVIGQVGNFFSDLPGFYTKTLEPELQTRLNWYREEVPPDLQVEIDTQFGNALNGLKTNASEYAASLGSSLLGAVTSMFRTLLFLAGFLIIPFWLFYVLLDEEKGKAAIDRVIPASIRADFWAIATIFDRIFSSYIRGQITLGAIIAVMSYIGLWAVDLIFGIAIPYKLLLALVAGFTELIPVIGPILGAIPAVIVGLFVSPTAGLIIAVLYIVIQQLENNILVPRIIGGVVEIHAAVLMILLVVSATTAGLLGVILSVPLAAVARDVYKYLNGRLRHSDDPQYLPAGALPIKASDIKDMDG
jgi:predicted PurR-regulated permease PerM